LELDEDYLGAASQWLGAKPECREYRRIRQDEVLHKNQRRNDGADMSVMSATVYCVAADFSWGISMRAWMYAEGKVNWKTGGAEDPEKVPGEEVHLTLKLTSTSELPYIVFNAGHFWEPGHRGDTCLLAFVALLNCKERWGGTLVCYLRV
jgi:hypothetical protein